MSFRVSLSGGLPKVHLTRSNKNQRQPGPADDGARPSRSTREKIRHAIDKVDQRFETAKAQVTQKTADSKQKFETYVSETSADIAYATAEETLPTIAFHATRGAILASGLRDEIANLNVKKNPLASDMPDLTMPGALPVEDDLTQGAAPNSAEQKNPADNSQNILERIKGRAAKYQQKVQDKEDKAAFHVAVDTVGMFANGATRAASKYVPSFPELPPELDRKKHDLPLMPGTLPEDVEDTKTLLSTPASKPSMTEKAKEKVYDKASDVTYASAKLIAQGALQKLSRNFIGDIPAQQTEVNPDKRTDVMPGSFPREG